MSQAHPTPRFNHVAVSLPPGRLDPDDRAELLRFYGEVFGWGEMPTMSVDGKQLVLRAHADDQFVFIHTSDAPMRCSGMEHVGMAVASPAELQEVLRRARGFQPRDGEVEIIDYHLEDHGPVKLHSFYVRYGLPIMFEVQCFEWAVDTQAVDWA